MSAIRPRRLGYQWSLHANTAGSENSVDTFQMLVVPSITSVVRSFPVITLNVTNPNAGADATNFTFHIQRSVDGGPFMQIRDYVAGFLATTVPDKTNIVTTAAATLPDGTAFTFPAGTVTHLTWPLDPSGSPTTSPHKANVLFDTTVLRTDGHSMVVPSGTIVTLATGSTWSQTIAPPGHTYTYKISVQNKFMFTGYSATNFVSPASAFVAQVQAAATRINNKVTLTWTDANVYSTGDHLEIWKDVNGAGYSLLTTLEKYPAVAMPLTYVEAFDFLTLVPATYSYKLRAVRNNPQDTGPFSNAQSLIVNFTLSQITALTATPVFGDTQINLAWTDPNLPANEAGLYIDRATGTGGQFQRIATVAAGTLAYSDVLVTAPGQTYQYRVTPFNALHPGPVSATASATTSLLTPTITTVDQLADVGARVFWSDLNQHATGYTIQRSLNGGAFSTVGTPAGTDRQFDDIVSLVIGDIVTYKIRAFNVSVIGTYSSTASLTIHRILIAPKNVTPVYVRYGLINVSWTGLNSGNRGVSIFRSTNGGAMALIATLPKDQRSYSDVFQTIPGQVYAYEVQDFDNQEVGPMSAIGVTSDPFDAPVSLQIAGVSPPYNVTLQWTFSFLPLSTNEDYVAVERAFGTGGFAEVARIPYGASPTYSASTSGGTPGDVVSFRVRKVKESYTILGTVVVPINYGEYSQVISTASPLSVPTAVVVTRSVAGVNHIAWSDTNTLATGFKIFRQTSLSGIVTPMIQVATVNGAAARFYDDTVESAATEVFTYSILAFNAQNSSIYSGFGTLTTRFLAPRLELEQPTRTIITLTWANTIGASLLHPDYSLAGDKLQLMRSVNGAAATVIYTLNHPFTSGFLFSDTPVTMGDTLAYSARYFSTAELGPTSTPVSVTVGDIINTPLGQIKQVRIHGSRTKFVQRDVFAVGLGGISKISFDGFGDPVVTSNTNAPMTNAYSGISGDQTRFVVFTGATPGSGNAVLVDTTTLLAVNQQPLSFVDIFGYGAITVMTATIDYYANVESAQYSDASSGEYAGWGLVNFTPIVNGNSSYPLRLVPWVTSLSAIDLNAMTQTLTSGSNFTVATPFSLSSIKPLRIENLNGDAVFCVNPTGTFTTVYRAQRSQSNYVKLVDIPARVMDIVSDGTGKLLALTIRGEIYLIDMQFNPTAPKFNIIGRIPFTPINAAGDMIDPATDFMSMELMANQKVAVAVGSHNQTIKFSSAFQSESHIYIYNVPGILSVNGSLTLSKTIDSIEKISSIAFDGAKYLYALSNDTQYRLIRFDVGF